LGPQAALAGRLFLAGSERYYAQDVVDFTNPAVDVTILGVIADLFRHRAPIPAIGTDKAGAGAG
jgi:hypothetical protein